MLDLLAGAELEAPQVRVRPHLLRVDLAGIVVYLSELRHPGLRPSEDVTAAASHPAVLVEPEESCIHPDTAPSLVHPAVRQSERAESSISTVRFLLLRIFLLHVFVVSRTTRS